MSLYSIYPCVAGFLHYDHWGNYPSQINGADYVVVKFRCFDPILGVEVNRTKTDKVAFSTCIQ